jgi:hypothetical protein
VGRSSDAARARPFRAHFTRLSPRSVAVLGLALSLQLAVSGSGSAAALRQQGKNLPIALPAGWHGFRGAQSVIYSPEELPSLAFDVNRSVQVTAAVNGNGCTCVALVGTPVLPPGMSLKGDKWPLRDGNDYIELSGRPLRAGTYSFTTMLYLPGWPNPAAHCCEATWDITVTGGASTAAASTAKTDVGEALNNLGRALAVMQVVHEIAAGKKDIVAAESDAGFVLKMYGAGPVYRMMQNALALIEAGLDAPTLPAVETDLKVAEGDLRAAEQVM